VTTTVQPTELSPLIGGEECTTGDCYEVRSPYDNQLVAIVHRAGLPEIESAIAQAERAFIRTRKLPTWRRAEILERVGTQIDNQQEDFARTIALEAGKPIRTARLEVARAAFTFRVAAEETKRIYGEIVPLDWLPGSEGRTAHVRHVPLGPISGICPYNFPLNLVAHKIAPALAAGNPIILRPASQTPISALKLGRIILEAGWPEDGIAITPSSTDAAAPLIEDERIRLLTFTGSPSVGWSLKARAGMKRVTLELGGNAAVVVAADADLPYAAERIVWGGTTNAGQTCISVQRVYYDASLSNFQEELVTRVEQLVVGDPLDDETDVGPLISRSDAERVERWLAEAVSGGARLLAGGSCDGNLFEPTVITDVRDEMKVSCEEVFAPVLTVSEYRDIFEALDRAGATRFGLQAGLFTNDLRIIDAALDRIDVGGLMVNDVSTFRIDHMPYGGVKHSGTGREGLRYAIEEMSELKLVTFNPRPLR
jgi:acyl-CoA reductase-like NAD-dependent aldehyde dehydrogenase